LKPAGKYFKTFYGHNLLMFVSG